MRVGFPGGPRLEWYDRNPQHKLLKYFVMNVAPHTITERWAYTVPAGKKAFVELMTIFIYRGAAATTEGLVYSNINITPFEEAPDTVVLGLMRTNVVGDESRDGIGQSAILIPGDALKGHTMDSSTGGTIDYLVASKVTEFDA